MTLENNDKKKSAHTDNSDADKGQSLGSYLQRERQKKQLTIEDVAKATCIGPEKLKALEAGNRNLLPVSVFTKGFVKIYAAHLDLDQAEVLERFSLEWVDDTATKTEVRSCESMAESSPFFLSLRFYSLLLIIALLISLAYFFFQADDSPSPASLTTIRPAPEQRSEQVVVKKVEVKQLEIISTAPSQETPLISPQSAGKIAMEDDGWENETSLTAKDNIVQTEHASKTAPSSVAAQPTPPQTVAPLAKMVPKPAPSVFQPVDLHILFLKKSRIAIAQDDGQLEKYIFAPGEESSWQAANQITLHIDTPGAVELTLNGAPITLDNTDDGPLAITLPSDLGR